MNLQNFENEFTILMENTVPTVQADLQRSHKAFDALMDPIEKVLQVANKVIVQQDSKLFQVEWQDRSPNGNYNWKFEVTLTAFREVLEITFTWPGGDHHIDVDIESDYYHNFRDVKGVLNDVIRGTLSFDPDAVPATVAQAMANVLTQFYKQ